MTFRQLRALHERWLAAVFIGLLMLVGPAVAAARTVLDLDTARQPVLLQDWGDAWIESGASLAPEQVATDTTIPWEPTAQGKVLRTVTGRALWIRFTIPPAPDAERWYLEVPSATVDRVTLYTLDGVGRWAPQSAGDLLPTTSWPVPHRHPLLPVELTAETPRRYLLRLENPGSFSVPLSFVSESYLGRREQRTSLILGIYFGLAALAVIVGALSAATLRDSAFGWYALTAALMGLGQAAITGIAGLHLWPLSPAWNDASKAVLSVLAAGTLCSFVSAAVSLPERSLRLRRLMDLVALLSVVTAVALLGTDLLPRSRTLALYTGLALLCAFTAGLWSARRGDRTAGWLLVSMVPLLASAVLPFAGSLGIVASSFWTVHGLQVGTSVVLPALLVILMLRSQQQRENRRRIQGLERIDPSTGLVTAPVFEERLVRLIARSHRLKHRSAVLLVDLTNLSQIRRTYDRRAADELPLRVAARLLASSRAIDTVARLSEHRFGLLLEGPLTAEEVAEAGPKVVAHCLMPFSGKPLEWVAQAHVGLALIPMDGTDAKTLLGRLDALLASVPAESRRAVFTLGKATS